RSCRVSRRGRSARPALAMLPCAALSYTLRSCPAWLDTRRSGPRACSHLLSTQHSALGIRFTRKLPSALPATGGWAEAFDAPAPAVLEGPRTPGRWALGRRVPNPASLGPPVPAPASAGTRRGAVALNALRVGGKVPAAWAGTTQAGADRLRVGVDE